MSILKKTLLILCIIAVAVGAWLLIPSADRQLWNERFQGALSEYLGKDDGGSAASKAYYTCPMHPQIRLPAPGECPICGMTLVKKSGADDGRAPGTIFLTDRQQQLAGVRRGKISLRELHQEVDTFGRIDYDERRISYVSSWVGGRVDKLLVDFTGVTVQKGHPLVWLYSPELITAQREYLVARQSLSASGGSSVSNTSRLVDGTRQKLLWWGLTEQQVTALERTGEVGSHITIHAPMGGTVIHKNVFEGQYVKPEQDLLRIVDLSHVWLYADLYEQQIAPVLQKRHSDYWTCPMHPKVRKSTAGICPQCSMPLLRTNPDIHLEITTQAYPGEVFTGRIAFIDPFLQPSTRTVRLRANIENPHLKLRPEMYARTRIKIEVGELLSVPESAVIRTGKRDMVLIDEGDGTYRPAAVELGLQWLKTSAEPKASDLPFSRSPVRFHEILGGVKAGDTVITSAGFLIGSEAQLQGAFEKMAEESEEMTRAREGATGEGMSGGDHAGSHSSMAGSGSSHSGTHSSSPAAKPEELKEFTGPYSQNLSRAIEYVTTLAELLASDKLKGETEDSGVQAVSGRLAASAREALEALSPADGSPEGIEAERGRIEALIGAADSLNSVAEAGQIKEIRTAFKAAAKAAVDLMRTEAGSRLASESGVVLKRCPMAPGVWPQKGAATRNPYYGSKMLKCGQTLGKR